jgi:hypothetical protein
VVGVPMGPFDRRRHRRFGEASTPTSPARTSSRNRRLSAPTDVSSSRSAQPTREHQSTRGHAQRQRTPRPPASESVPGPPPRPRRRPAPRSSHGEQRSASPLRPERDRIVEDLERCPNRMTSRKSCPVRSAPSSCWSRNSANGCNPHPNKAFICSAVTGSPTAKPSIPPIPEPTHTPGDSPARCNTTLGPRPPSSPRCWATRCPGVQRRSVNG